MASFLRPKADDQNVIREEFSWCFPICIPCPVLGSSFLRHINRLNFINLSNTHTPLLHIVRQLQRWCLGKNTLPMLCLIHSHVCVRLLVSWSFFPIRFAQSDTWRTAAVVLMCNCDVFVRVENHLGDFFINIWLAQQKKSPTFIS